MATTIQVTPGELESAAGRIEGLAADYKAQYEALYNETNAMHSTWQGEDNVAFVNQIEGFKEDFGKMHSLMLNYADFLRKSAAHYRETQDTIITEAKKLTN